MTEEIIINGVNVSECEFIAKEDEYSSYDRVYKGQCRCSNEEMCKNHPNCFYKKALKQLKRKEQECEALKQILTEIKEIAKNMNNECFYSDFDCKDCDMKNGCTYFNKKQILQKNQ